MARYTYTYKVIRPRLETIEDTVTREADSYREGLLALKKELYDEYSPTSKGCNVIIKIDFSRLFYWLTE